MVFSLHVRYDENGLEDRMQHTWSLHDALTNFFTLDTCLQWQLSLHGKHVEAHNSLVM